MEEGVWHMNISVCPYCQGKEIVKRGKRKKKLESVQQYFCKKCQKKFTPGITKYKTFPMRIILSAITFYNRLHTLEESAKAVSEKYGIRTNPQNIANWLKDLKSYLPFLRMRSFIAGKYKRSEAFTTSRMFHGQIYDFMYHRAKTDCMLEEEFKHQKFRPLREFLELVIAECPHQIFKNSQHRASEYKDVFNLDGVRITAKTNMACRSANFVMQAVDNNQLRHQVLQQFMLFNDSVTVATEAPVLLSHEDLLHYQNELNFEIPLELGEEEVITGHIDFIQIRNGMIHILDYKPSAKKEKPVDQLTLYALALSRLTTLRLFHFKCAWFDEEDYFEFFPLHVVYKKKGRKRK